MAELEKIVVINDQSFVNGGQAKVAIESAKGLAREGFDVTFFSACGPADKSLAEAGVEIVDLGQKDILSEPDRQKAALQGIWNHEAATALDTLLAAFDPENSIVHCHGFAKALSPAIGPVITNGRIPHVYTMHEYFLACPNGGFYDYRKNEICTRRPLGISCLATNCDVRHPAHKAWRVARQVAAWAAYGLPGRLTDVIYISETQKRAMLPYLPKGARLHHVPNPVALRPKAQVDVAANDIFLFVGRLSPEKGALLFAKAAREAGVKAVFVGDGPERAAIERANPQATITGWLSSGEVDRWLDKARCLVFPSLWYEGQPLVPLEASGRGVPVLCGAWSAAAEAVEDGRTGLIVHSAETADWAARMRRISDDVSPYVAGYPIKAFIDDVSMAAHLKSLSGVYRECGGARS